MATRWTLTLCCGRSPETNALRRGATEIIQDESNSLSISIVTYWELQVKQTIRKLELELQFNEALCQWIEVAAMHWLGLSREHCNQYRALALHHPGSVRTAC